MLGFLRSYLRHHWFFNLVQLVAVGGVVYWWRHIPVPGYAIGVLAVLAAIMSLHADMRSWQKAVWMLLIGAFLFLEFRAIDKERSIAAQEQAAVRAEQLKNFGEIARGIDTTIEHSQKQFEATMARTEAVMRKEERIAKTTNQSLEQLTGGGQFCYLTIAAPPIRLNDGQIVFEVAKMNSGPLPLDICHVLVQRNLPIKSQEDAFRAMQVIVDRQLGPLPPGKDKGFATDIFLPEGSYYLQINTRNNRFYETLTMHTNPILEEIEVRDEKWNIVYSESKKEPKK